MQSTHANSLYSLITLDQCYIDLILTLLLYNEQVNLHCTEVQTCNKVYAMFFCVVKLYRGLLNRTAPINACRVIPACNSKVLESPNLVSKLAINTGISISPTA
jgi:hypothetical protein